MSDQPTTAGEPDVEPAGQPDGSTASAGDESSVEPGSGDDLDLTPEAAALIEDVHPDTIRAAERLDDLRRLQAEYVNYKKRVDRDRLVARDQGVTQVLEGLLPVLDDIHLAREHGDVDGPFAAVADKLTTALGKFGVEQVGEPGQEFDPAIHEALMHVSADLPEDATTTTVVQVLQPGYKVGDRVVRPARVSVADPA